MKIGHGYNSGIGELRDLGIEGILSILLREESKVCNFIHLLICYFSC
jgi:hypothetical protein